MATQDEVTASNVTDPTTTETVMVATAGTPISLGGTSKGIRVTVSVDLTEGTGGTSFLLRVRQGNLVTGTQVGSTVTQTEAAAASGVASFDVFDSTPFAFSNNLLQYCVTCQQTAATANGTALEASVVVEDVTP